MSCYGGQLLASAFGQGFFEARQVLAHASLKKFRPYCCVMYIDKENQRNLQQKSKTILNLKCPS